jgi:hypothetical protein
MFEYDHPKINSFFADTQYATFIDMQPAGKIRVECTTVDAFCSAHAINHIDILKIDTEGFELQVLTGAASMLAKKAINFVYFEFTDIAPKDGTSGGALIPIDQVLRSHGYRFIATYTDYILPEGELFGCRNALYALPPTNR